MTITKYRKRHGSISDAYRYTKKTLLALGMERERIQRYMDAAKADGVTSWTRYCFNRLRQQFFHNGVSDIYFAPGIARIAYGELDMDDDWEEANSLIQLDTITRLLSISHKYDYSRHLEYMGTMVSYDDLSKMYGEPISRNLAELKKSLKEREYGDRRYNVIWMNDFSVAHEYYKYTKFPGCSWCHLNTAYAFKSYEKGKSIKLYLATLPGFETMTPDDPLFGESMLGIDIGPSGELIHVNNRWNHARDTIDERKGDNKYSAEELSDLMGGPYFELCPPYTKAELGEHGITTKSFTEIVAESERGTYIDPRDGTEYTTVRIGKQTWIAENITYTADSDGKRGIYHTQYERNPEHPEYGVYYSSTGAKLAVPPGCRMPSQADIEYLSNYIKLDPPYLIAIQSELDVLGERSSYICLDNDENAYYIVDNQLNVGTEDTNPQVACTDTIVDTITNAAMMHGRDTILDSICVASDFETMQGNTQNCSVDTVDRTVTVLNHDDHTCETIDLADAHDTMNDTRHTVNITDLNRFDIGTGIGINVGTFTPWASKNSKCARYRLSRLGIETDNFGIYTFGIFEGAPRRRHSENALHMSMWLSDITYDLRYVNEADSQCTRISDMSPEELYVADIGSRTIAVKHSVFATVHDDNISTHAAMSVFKMPLKCIVNDV